MDLSRLTSLVERGAALRAKTALAPAGGRDDKIFPATFEGGVYATEQRRIGEADVDCVLLDSVQSQANRFEAALQDAVDRGLLSIPCLRVQFPEELARELGPITSLTAPHRCYDAILRDSSLGETPFPKSDVGEALSAARTSDATALYRYCPTALVFGAWDSTGPRGGLGAKFTRAVSSEIVGIGVRAGVRTSSRVDPLGIRAQVTVVVDEDDPAGWHVASEGEKGAKRPSEIVHGNIAPSITAANGGVTIDRAEQTWVLSLPALRRYRFPIDGNPDDGRDLAGRTALAALALTARALAEADGLFLRSRCQLVRDGSPARLEAVATDGSVQDLNDLTPDGALKLLEAAASEAANRGLPWETTEIRLVAQPRLVELVQRSFDLAPKAHADA